MPEGPEVEVVVRKLKPFLMGGEIVEARSNSPRFVVPPLGKIQSVHRHGKWIILGMPSVGAVMINLGMSGRFVVGMKRPKHVRWEILVQTAEGRRRAIRYVDPRSFGRLSIKRGASAKRILAPLALAEGVPLLNLGPDTMCRFMTSADLKRRTARWRAHLDTGVGIKKALLDQSRLAGLGNIYAAEACFIGRVHPTRPANSLSNFELQRMAQGVPLMLKTAVCAGGTSFGDANSYRDVDGREGSNSRNLFVYGRAGLPCRRCGEKIQVIRDQRSTFFCPKCQG